MAEMDPDVERRLRGLYEHIEASPVPERLGRMAVPGGGRSRRPLLVAGAAALTAALFAAVVVVGLTNHRAGSPTPSGPAATAPIPTGSQTPAPSATPTDMPSPHPSPSTDPSVVAGPVPAGFAAASVTFVSPQVGWVLGTAPCGQSNPCLTVLRTADGGHTWVPLVPPPVRYAALGADPAHPVGLPSTGSGVQSIRFADSRNGWLFTPELWATHDGGVHWALVPLPGVGSNSAVARLEASAGMVHAVVFDSTGGTAAIESAAVGGDAWQKSPTTISIGAGPVPDAQLVLHGTAGWIIENDRTVVGGARYLNGRWTPWQPPCLYSGGSAALAASTSTDLVAVCDEGVWSGGPPVVHAYTSHDGGATFQRSAGHLLAGAGGTVASARPMQAVIADTYYQGSAALLLTTDGGATATVVYQGPRVASDLGFTNAIQGVVVVASQAGSTGPLLMTHDGGVHWAPVTFATAIG